MTDIQQKKLLNVGGGSKAIPIPPQYDNWEMVLLDIEPGGEPDIICDAREIMSLPESGYDAVYCSHNLEHYYWHDVPKVLKGFLHVVKNNGFVDIRVPDIGELFKIVASQDKDIGDVLYQSPAGPILVRDVLYGYGVEIERSGKDFYAHKTGFTAKSLKQVLNENGFSYVFISQGQLEIRAIAFRNAPTDEASSLFNLKL